MLEPNQIDAILERAIRDWDEAHWIRGTAARAPSADNARTPGDCSNPIGPASAFFCIAGRIDWACAQLNYSEDEMRQMQELIVQGLPRSIRRRKRPDHVLQLAEYNDNPERTWTEILELLRLPRQPAQ